MDGLLSILSAWTQELKDDRLLQLVNLTTIFNAITVKVLSWFETAL